MNEYRVEREALGRLQEEISRQWQDLSAYQAQDVGRAIYHFGRQLERRGEYEAAKVITLSLEETLRQHPYRLEMDDDKVIRAVRRAHHDLAHFLMYELPEKARVMAADAILQGKRIGHNVPGPGLGETPPGGWEEAEEPAELSGWE